MICYTLPITDERQKRGTLLKERKYIEDYALESYLDEKGHDKRRVVHRGDSYRYQSPAKAKKALQRLLGCFLLGAVLYVCYLLLGTPSTYCMYVLPIAACAVFPFAYWAMGLVSMWHSVRGMKAITRTEKEKGIARIVRSAIGCAAFLSMAGVGCVVFCLRNRAVLLQELPGFALLICAAACSIAAFRLARATDDAMRTETGEDHNKEGLDS